MCHYFSFLLNYVYFYVSLIYTNPSSVEIVINVAVQFDLCLDRQLFCDVSVAIVYAVKVFCNLFPVANVS